MTLCVENLLIKAQMKGGTVSTPVRGLSFELPYARSLAVVGRSGCGKSMSALAILGLLPENCTAYGSVRFSGNELLSQPKNARRELLGRDFVLIPQSGADFLNPSLTIKRQFWQSLRRLEIPKKQWEERAHTLLSTVGFDDIDHVLSAYPFQLSGGMAQRVVMAIAAAGTPSLVIADEPTRGVDAENTARFLENIDTLFPGAAVLLITHDISVAAKCGDILVMKDGEMMEYGASAFVLQNPQSEYTKKLLCDLPESLGKGVA